MISQLNDNLNGLYFGMKHDIYNHASALETTVIGVQSSI